MPKQLTYSEESPAFILTPDGNEIFQPVEGEWPEGSKWRRRGVHVGWMKGKNYVELGVASFDPSKEYPKDGMFLMLDRAATNRLINSLRKARDDAFGKDA